MSVPETSIGSYAFALCSLLVITFLVLILLRYFLPLRTTPAYLLVPVFLAIALPISIILLVPIDLASTSSTSDEGSRGICLPDRVMLVAWRSAYWLTFVLTWFILPLLGEYTDSGYRIPKDRILYSLKQNGRYQLTVLSCGIVGLTYVFLQNGFKGTSVQGLIMALAYCWALVQAIYLMGHGLVAVPRKLVRNANNEGRLKRIQIQAPKLHEKLQDAITELNEVEGVLTQLSKRKNGVSRDHQEWIEDLVITSSISDSGPEPTRSLPNHAVPAVITDRYLAELGRKLRRARHKRVRFISEWDGLLQQATEVGKIVDSAGSKQLFFGKPSPDALWLSRFSLLHPYTRYLLYSRVIPSIKLVSGFFFSLASVCIVWSELIKFSAPQLSIISLTVVHHANSDSGKIGFAGQVIAALWIFYMCATALASFNDIKIWGNRALVKRNTYGESACWYSGQVAKLTVPLSYNFVTFLPSDIYQKTTFYHFLGRLIVLTPLGKGFDYFFPIFILIPVCATLFNFYGRIQKLSGFGIYEDDEEEDPSGYGTTWREGRDLLERELSGRGTDGLSTPLDGASSPVPPHQRGGTSTGNQRNLRAPALYVPPAQRTPLPERQGPRPSTAAQAAEEEDDEGAFTGFAHRVRNTFENVETPDWVADLGKRPKWMGGTDGNQESSGRAEAGRGLGRWFGGRPSDGRVRL